jgi:hypothetical protein
MKILLLLVIFLITLSSFYVHDKPNQKNEENRFIEKGYQRNFGKKFNGVLDRKNYHRRKNYKEKRKEQPTIITGNIGYCAILIVYLKNPSNFVDYLNEASKFQDSNINNNPEKLITGVGFSTKNWDMILKEKNRKVPEGNN